jgi:hypothetical protein
VRFLLVEELHSGDIGPREVREVQIANSKKGELKSVKPPGAIAQVTRPVPPLDGSLGMHAVVARKREPRGGRGRARREKDREREAE